MMLLGFVWSSWNVAGRYKLCTAAHTLFFCYSTTTIARQYPHCHFCRHHFADATATSAPILPCCVGWGASGCWRDPGLGNTGVMVKALTQQRQAELSKVKARRYRYACSNSLPPPLGPHTPQHSLSTLTAGCMLFFFSFVMHNPPPPFACPFPPCSLIGIATAPYDERCPLSSFLPSSHVLPFIPLPPSFHTLGIRVTAQSQAQVTALP
jgi:hypothetical protein